MDLIIKFIVFSQNALVVLSNIGNDMVNFLSREFTLLGDTYSLLGIIFGTGLFVYLGARLISHLTDIVIPN